MRVCRFEQNGKELLGFYHDTHVLSLESATAAYNDATHDALDLAKAGGLLDLLPPDGALVHEATTLAAFVDRNWANGLQRERLPIEKVKLLVPIPRPNSGRKEREKDKFFDWLHGKWFDSFCPCGPCIASSAAITDPQMLRIQLIVNGEVKQDSTTATQIFPVAAVIEFISSFVTLEPGDIISTGTPTGVLLNDLPVYGDRAGWISHAIESFQTMPPRHQGTPIPASRLIAVLQGWDGSQIGIAGDVFDVVDGFDFLVFSPLAVTVHGADVIAYGESRGQAHFSATTSSRKHTFSRRKVSQTPGCERLPSGRKPARLCAR